MLQITAATLRHFLHRACATLAVFALLPSLHAQVPQLVSYQGRVAAHGVNFDGPGQFAFALVNANGSTTFWSNDGTSTAGSQPAAAVPLTVIKGLYSILLGDTTVANMTTIPATVWSNADVRLRVWFNDGANGFQLLTPDQRLAPNGYLPDNAVTSTKIAAGAVTSTQLAPGAVGTGNIATGAVGAAQIAVGAVGTAQIATNAVTSSNIAGGAVGNAQLGLGTISGVVSCNKTDPTHTYVYLRGTSSVAYAGAYIGNNCYLFQLTLVQPGPYLLVVHASNGTETAYPVTAVAGQNVGISIAAVNLLTDPNNCGSCSNVCSTPNATSTCSSGSCSVASCNFGYADCDGLASNGCETSVINDLNNCGSCGRVCPNNAGSHATPSCSNGACTVACSAGFGDCNQNAADGCETNLTSDVNNCSACGFACPAVSNGVAGCVASSCTILSCNAGFTHCGSSCVNTSTDRNNCGGCGHLCVGLQICSSGLCQ